MFTCRRPWPHVYMSTVQMSPLPNVQPRLRCGRAFVDEGSLRCLQLPRTGTLRSGPNMPACAYSSRCINLRAWVCRLRTDLKWAGPFELSVYERDFLLDN